MIRNLKALGLALVAVFALSAMAASGASADAFTAEVAPVTLTGIHDPGTSADKFTTTSGSVSCPDATYHGTLATTSATSITITPNFNGPSDTCTAFGVLPTIIDLNRCRFTFNINGGVSTEGTVDIHECQGDEITVTVNETTPPNSLTTKCTVHIPEQTGINGIKYTSIGAGATREITVDINSNNIKYTHTAGTGLGACTGGSAVNGTFVGNVVVTGETDTGSTHVGLFMSNN